MVKIKVKTKVKKVKRKFPVEFISPRFLGHKNIGKSNVSDLNSLVGRIIKMNFMYITGSMRNQNVKLSFRVTKVESQKASSEVSKYEQVAYLLAKKLRKNSTLVEDVIKAKSKDKREVIIKPFVITRQKISSQVATNLRLKIREEIIDEITNTNQETIIEDVINNKFQTLIKSKVQKITPLKHFEIKKAEVK